MKKIVLLVLGILALAAVFIGWKIFGPTLSVPEGRYLYIATGSGYEDVQKELIEKKIVGSTTWFSMIAGRLDYPSNVKAGKYEITKGMSVFSLVRTLRNGKQTPVNLVITKLRTKEDFASLAGKKFEFDSTAFLEYLNNADSLKQYNLDTNTVLTAVFPDTYTYFWNTTPSKVFAKLREQYSTFWNQERVSKATAKGLTPQTAYIIASIVEEETNNNAEKGNIASVYMNRMAKGMRLGADPTVKFALRDFGLKRIYNKHLTVESPYNTYRVSGLPPGPICTPSKVTIDAVLNAAPTDYLFFVAKSDFSGQHSFAATYDEHLKLAKQYQKALDSLMLQKQKANDNLAQ